MFNKPSEIVRFEASQRARLAARWTELCETRKHRDKTLGDDYPTIADFYKGRNVFITGATGLIGKLILEKLLWGCPEIGNIYVLIRPRRGQDIHSRIRDILELPIFSRIRERNPADLQKVIALRGDLAEEKLGLSSGDRNTLVNNVSVVFHSAANLRLNGPVKDVVLHNVGGAKDIVDLARETKCLKVLMHVSTAFCFTNHQPTLERIYDTEYHWKDVLEYAKLPDSEALDYLGPKLTGFQPNNYLFSKALAENVMEEASYDIPVVVVRPSIVISAVREPLPGWMDNLHGFAVFWGIYSKGYLRVFYSKRGSDMKFGTVAADIVCNAVISASWAKGTEQCLANDGGNADVVNVGFGDIAPMKLRDLKTYIHYMCEKQKFVAPGVVRYPYVLCTSNKFCCIAAKFFWEILFLTLLDFTLILSGRKPKLMRMCRKVEMRQENLRYFLDNEVNFDTTNMWRLSAMLHPSDRKDYELRVLGIHDSDVQVFTDRFRGVIEYAFNEPTRGAAEVQKDWMRLTRLWWGELLFYICMAVIVLCLLTRLY